MLIFWQKNKFIIVFLLHKSHNKGKVTKGGKKI